LSLLAFAIACNGGSAVFINVPCKLNNQAPPSNGTTTTTPQLAMQQIKASYGYPYDLTEAGLVETSGCPNGQAPVKLDQSSITTSTYNIVSSAQFFVFVGVMSFLYSIAFTIIYVFFRHKYTNIIYIPLIVINI
jgi:hypothetical protein